ncbi:MAG TPA: glycosyltransferase, partial [Thermoanaerobaculia bacterium]
ALADRDDIHFVFAGFGAKRKWLEGAASAMTNVTLLERQPRARLNDLLTACDVSVVSLAGGMSGVSVPSRMYNVLASGRPMLAMAAPDSEPAAIIAEGGVGWRVGPGDVAALVSTIAAAAANPRLVAEMGARARRAAEEKYSLASIGERYRALVREVVAGRPR